MNGNYGNPMFGNYQMPNYGMGQKIEVVKVNGEDGAKAYQLPPNSSILLLDLTGPYVWLKTTDGASYPSLNCYKIEPFVKEESVVQTMDPSILKGLEDRIANLERMMKNDNKSNVRNASGQNQQLQSK